MRKHKKTTVKKLNSSRFIFIYIALSFFILLPGLIGWIAINKKDLPCANSISCIQDLSGTFEQAQTEGIFMGKTVNVPQQFAFDAERSAVLGDTSEEKIIYIDLTNQKLLAYEGDKKVHEFLVSTGKWGQTPTGTFYTWVKLRATLMSGGDKAKGTYYYLPNVQYTMFFYNNEIPKTRGYAIHGAYWHNNFGHPMSHGCVNMKTEEAALVYEWANPPATGHTTYVTKDNPGTKIVIYGEAPKE